MTALPPGATAAGAKVRVWDLAVRLLHWMLVASVALSWITTFGWASVPGPWHQPAGYVALAVVALRVPWGFVGSRYARFAQFVRSPRRTWSYLRNVVARAEPRYVGHNPLGAWMVLALVGHVLALALTGWLYTTDWLWGDATVEAVHLMLAWTLLALVAVHVAGVVYTGVRHRENLVAAMVGGRKRGPAPGDVA